MPELIPTVQVDFSLIGEHLMLYLLRVLKTRPLWSILKCLKSPIVHLATRHCQTPHATLHCARAPRLSGHSKLPVLFLIFDAFFQVVRFQLIQQYQLLTSAISSGFPRLKKGHQIAVQNWRHIFQAQYRIYRRNHLFERATLKQSLVDIALPWG